MVRMDEKFAIEDAVECADEALPPVLSPALIFRHPCVPALQAGEKGLASVFPGISATGLMDKPPWSQYQSVRRCLCLSSVFPVLIGHSVVCPGKVGTL